LSLHSATARVSEGCCRACSEKSNGTRIPRPALRHARLQPFSFHGPRAAMARTHMLKCGEPQIK
jgi:hypothetical protein